jgi:hypothetical protein
MSLPSDKPYKSRLFNFINRHYIKFNSQINVKFRELGYVAKTGLQTLVFPLFWLWETTQKIGNTFSPASSSVSSKLTDSSSQKILASSDDVINSVNEVINLHPQLTSFPVKNFQGFASRIKDKHIICIVDNNKFTDIIPVNKQEEVKDIINNITDKLTNVQLLPSASSANFFSRFLARFNIFRKSKIEVEISQDINNLKESDLAINNQSSSSLLQPEKNKIILLIDNFFVILETITFLGDRKTSNNSQQMLDSEDKIINGKNQDNNIINYSQTLKSKDKEKLSIFLLIQKAIDYFFNQGNNEKSLTEGNENINDKLSFLDHNNPSLSLENSANNNPIQTIIVRSQDTIENIIPFVQDTTDKIISQGLNQLNIIRDNLDNKLNNPDDPFQVKILIWAAINYFFSNKNKSNNLSSKDSNNESFLPSFSETNIIVINEEVVDPWLLWEDLYNDNTVTDFSINNNPLTFASNEEIITNTTELVIESGLELGIVTTLKIPEIDQENYKIVKKESNVKSVVLQEEKTVRLEKEKIILEEIEVKVIEIKYEKHFLEIILEKLDQFILWLEEIIVKIVNQIKLLTQK